MAVQIPVKLQLDPVDGLGNRRYARNLIAGAALADRRRQGITYEFQLRCIAEIAPMQLAGTYTTNIQLNIEVQERDCD